MAACKRELLLLRYFYRITWWGVSGEVYDRRKEIIGRIKDNAAPTCFMVIRCLASSEPKLLGRIQ